MDECKRKVSSDIDDTCHKRKKSKLHKTERSPSRSSASSSPSCKKKKRNKSSKKSHRRSQPSSTSSSYDSSDGGHHSMKSKKKKKRKKKKKDHKKKSKLTKSKQEIVKEESSSEDIIGPNPSFMSNDNMKPLTKEEWEKQQSVVRKVYDEETGRNRLIRGDGEILEEIVSYKQHSDINKAATLADGFEFKKRTGLNKKL